ncbi:MAG: hypothetical protein B6D56_02695 [Candidatus Omnitrophica bacterium 4484_70.1]|nr:MAG: hypothetical protein B6D56_02695 [Candidatus Omnitrophica bacterium 4484_70.1]
MRFKFLDFISRLIPYTKERFLVIDLGKGFIKILVMRDSQIENFFIEKNENGSFKLAIEWLKKEKLQDVDVYLVVKGEEILLRYIPFPKIEKEKIKEVFNYEIARFIPFKKEEIYFDVCILEENYSKEEFFLLLAVAKKDFINSLIEKFKKEDINIVRIIPNNVALINLYLNFFLKEERNIALVDIGVSSTLLSLVKGKTPCLSREIKVSLFDLFERISKKENIEKDKIIDAEEKFKEIIKDFGWELSQEIKNSFDYFEINWGQKIEKIFLTGGGAKFENLFEVLKNSLDLEIEIMNALKKIKYYPSQLLNFKEILATSIGASI